MKTALARLLLIVLILTPIPVAADCPDCFKDQQPLDPAHGTSTDGRVKVVVGIAVGLSNESWSNPRAQPLRINPSRRP